MKRVRHANNIILSLALTMLIGAVAWVDTHGTIKLFPDEREDAIEVMVNSTSLSEALFSDETVKAMGLTGQSYSKHIVDQALFSSYRPTNYDVKKDAFSISKVTRNHKGSGLSVRVLTPTMFSPMTLDGMMNALATAGVTDTHIDVLSPALTTGENALVGVFPHFITEEADNKRMELAQDEMSWLVHLGTHYRIDVSSLKRMNVAWAETKLSLLKYNTFAGRTTIRQNLRQRWSRHGLPAMSQADEATLIEWLLSYQDSEAIHDRHTQTILESVIQQGKEGEA